MDLSGFDDLGNFVLTTAFTDASGKYEFNNLRPSDPSGYVLIETTPAGYLDGKDSLGSQGGNLANDVISDIVLKSGLTGDAHKAATKWTFVVAGVVSLALAAFRQIRRMGVCPPSHRMIA